VLIDEYDLPLNSTLKNEKVYLKIIKIIKEIFRRSFKVDDVPIKLGFLKIIF